MPYLDDNGNPISDTGPRTYLDDSGTRLDAKEQFRLNQQRIRQGNAQSGAIAGDRFDLSGAGAGDLIDAAKRTADQFFVDPAKRVGFNLVNMAAQLPADIMQHAQMGQEGRQQIMSGDFGNGISNLVQAGTPFSQTIIDTAKAKAAHASNAASAYANGDIIGGLKEAARVPLGMDTAAHIGSEAVNGDVGGAVGDVLTPFVAAELPGAVNRATAGTRTALAETAAPQMMNKLLAKTKDLFKFGANPGKEVAGLTFSSAEDLIPQLEARMGQYDARLNDVLSSDAAKTKAIHVTPMIEQGFAKAISDAEVTNPALAERLRTARDGVIAEAKKYTRGGSDWADPKVAQAIKKRIGDLTKWKKAADEGTITVNGALQDVYQTIDDAIDTAVPAAKPLNERYANALSAKRGAEMMQIEGLRFDPMNWFKPTTWLNSPAVRSRVASLFTGGPSAMPELPPTTPSPTIGEYIPPQRPQLSASQPQRALPPAPEGAPNGFISSDDLRRVGTRLGPTEGADSAVFAPQYYPPQQPTFGASGVTPPPSQTAPQAINFAPPDYGQAIAGNMANDPFYAQFIRQDMQRIAEDVLRRMLEQQAKARGIILPQ